jgi:NTE family protein
MVGDKTFADLHIPVTVIAVDLKTGREIHIQSDRLDEALLATMAIPGLFTPLLRDGLHLIDGGALNPLPVDVARASGHRVVAVDVLFHQPPPGTPVQLFESHGPMRYAADIAERIGLTMMMEAVHQTAIVMTRHTAQLKLQLYKPDLLLQPDVGSIGLFAADRAPEAFLKGVETAELALPQLESLVHNPIAALMPL